MQYTLRSGKQNEGWSITGPTNRKTIIVMAKKAFKWIIGFGFVLFLLYVIFYLLLLAALGPSRGKIYTKKDLIENYKRRKTQILNVQAYYASIVPRHKTVAIEFTDDHTLARLEVESLDSVTGAIIYPIFEQWDLATNSGKVDSVMATLHWTKAMLQELKQKLDSAHCISVRNGEPGQVGFQRSGMGMFFYDLFTRPMTDSVKNRYNNGCTYIFYNPTVALEYGGGAIGPQCFSKD
jgi:hypothetical protein